MARPLLGVLVPRDRESSLRVAGIQPPAVCSCAQSCYYRRRGWLLLKVSLTGDPQAVVPQTQVWAGQNLGWHLRVSQRDGSQGPPPESVFNDTVENSVCPKRPVRYGCMSIHGMSEHRPSVAFTELCWPWSPLRAMWCMSGSRVLRWRYGPGLRVRSVVVGPTALLLFGMCQSEMMEPLRVKDTAAPEVKFLDRC